MVLLNADRSIAARRVSHNLSACLAHDRVGRMGYTRLFVAVSGYSILTKLFQCRLVKACSTPVGVGYQ